MSDWPKDPAAGLPAPGNRKPTGRPLDKIESNPLGSAPQITLVFPVGLHAGLRRSGSEAEGNFLANVIGILAIEAAAKGPADGA